MTTTKHTITDDMITILPDGQLEVREATVLLDAGQVDPDFPPKYHRYVLHPGDDLTGKAPRIVAVAGVLWTSEVVAAWEAAHPKEVIES